MADVSIRIASSLREIGEGPWRSLTDDTAIPFLEWDWLEALEATGCVAADVGWSPAHLGLYRESALIAAAPAYIKTHSEGEFVYDWAWANAALRTGISYYPKLVLGVPFTPATGSRILVAKGEDRTYCERALFAGAAEFAKEMGFSSVHVLFLTDEEAKASTLAGYMIRSGVQYHWENHDFKCYDDFLSTLTSKKRNQLKRERRDLMTLGVDIRTRRGDELSPRDAGLIFELYSSTIEKYSWGRQYLSAAFFARILGTFRHRIEFVEAKKEGRVIAGAFNVASSSCLYGRYWGSFEDLPFLHFNVCLYHSIEECVARGLVRFEGGAGGEHKLVRGFVPRLTQSAHWFRNPRFGDAILRFTKLERAEIEAAWPNWLRLTGIRGF